MPKIIINDTKCGMACQRCYVGLVAVGVQEQAEDILVPPLLRNCLTLMTFPFLVIISPPEQWSLQ